MLGVMFLNDKVSAFNRLFRLNNLHFENINLNTKAIYVCFNNIEEKEVKFANKIVKNMKKRKITEVLIQKDIYDIFEILIEKIIENDIRIITGNSIYENNVNKVIDYIFDNNKNITVEQMKFGILINTITYKRLEYIKEIAKKVKTMTIITEDVLKFENTCKNIFETEGIAIKLSNNFKNGLKGCNCIINFDISGKDVMENIPNNCIFINLTSNILKTKKNFKGILVNDINVEISKDDMKELYKYIEKDKFRNLAIAEAIKKDIQINVAINGLIGLNGDIPLKDIKNFNIIRTNKENKNKKGENSNNT